MIELHGNLFQYPAARWVCITTNPVINSQGLAVMGAGVAKQVTELVPDVQRTFAQKIREKGNVVQGICYLPSGQLLVSFPVKHHWQEPADLDLIIQSAAQLKNHWQEHGNECVVALPRPGCGDKTGKLDWKDVRPYLGCILAGESFHVVDLKCRKKPKLG